MKKKKKNLQSFMAEALKAKPHCSDSPSLSSCVSLKSYIENLERPTPPLMAAKLDGDTTMVAAATSHLLCLFLF